MQPANNAPTYAAMYAELAEVFRRYGYALAIHGSLQKDFDLVAIPWSEKPSDPVAVLLTLESEFALAVIDIDKPTMKPHGRKAWTVATAWGENRLDLSFMPRDKRIADLEADAERLRKLCREWIEAEDSGNAGYHHLDQLKDDIRESEGAE